MAAKIIWGEVDSPKCFLKRLGAFIEEASIKEKIAMQQGRVILADKHANMLGGICRLLEDEVKTVLMVADEKSLYHALENHNPDVVVVDLSLPISAKTSIAWALKKDFPKIKFIILSIHDEKSVVDDVMAAGVEGFVLKRRAVIDLIPAIREVLQGKKYTSPDMNDVS